MSLEKCKRIMQILEEGKDIKGKVHLSQVELAIFEAAGTDPRTIKLYLKALKRLRWLTRDTKNVFTIDEAHLVSDF